MSKKMGWAVARAVVVWSALTCAAGVQAQDATRSQVPTVSKQWRAEYDVDATGRSTASYSTLTQLMHSSALERIKSFSFSYSASIQNGEIVEAYTLKSDGRRIEAPATNYQTEVNGGREGANPLFSDQTELSVVFPDVAVGDSVGVKYRIADKEAMFPGAFSIVQSLSRFNIYEDVQITVRYAKALPLRFESHDLKESPEVTDGDFNIRHWDYRNPTARAWNESDEGIWRLDEVPILMASTFPDYEAIAQAYGARALPKAQATPRITALAESIVGKQTDPLTRARLIYEWVSQNITYGGNCIGVGAVVPRDPDVVLDNKLGDCKDHATLLQSLLQAVGVRSEQVLINAGSQYDLSSMPVVSNVNHVINFLPDWKIYVDATAKDIPFGYLPNGYSSKPVIHVGAPKALAVIPQDAPDRAQQRVLTSMRIAADGSATGTLKVELKGVSAAGVRSYMRGLQVDDERDFVKHALRRFGPKTKGSLNRGDMSDANALSDSYAFSITFELDNYLKSGSTGAFTLAPLLSLPQSVNRLAGYSEKPPVTRRQYCYGFKSRETYDIELAPGVTFTQLPKALVQHGKGLDFASSYQRTKSGWKISREVFDKTPQGVCSAKLMNDWQTEVLPISDNLSSQVFYKRSPR